MNFYDEVGKLKIERRQRKKKEKKNSFYFATHIHHGKITADKHLIIFLKEFV